MARQKKINLRTAKVGTDQERQALWDAAIHKTIEICNRGREYGEMDIVWGLFDDVFHPLSLNKRFLEEETGYKEYDSLGFLGDIASIILQEAYCLMVESVDPKDKDRHDTILTYLNEFSFIDMRLGEIFAIFEICPKSYMFN